MDQPIEQPFCENIVLHQLQQIDKEEKIIMFRFNLIQEWSYKGLPVQLHPFYSYRLNMYHYGYLFLNLFNNLSN